MLYESLAGGKPFLRDGRASRDLRPPRGAAPPSAARPAARSCPPRSTTSSRARWPRTRTSASPSAGELAGAALAAPAVSPRTTSSRPRQRSTQQTPSPRPNPRATAALAIAGALALLLAIVAIAAALLATGDDNPNDETRRPRPRPAEPRDLKPPESQPRGTIRRRERARPGPGRLGLLQRRRRHGLHRGPDHPGRRRPGGARGRRDRAAGRCAAARASSALRVIDGPTGAGASSQRARRAGDGLRRGEVLGAHPGRRGPAHRRPARHDRLPADSATATRRRPPSSTSLRSGRRHARSRTAGRAPFDYEYLYNATIEPDDDRRRARRPDPGSRPRRRRSRVPDLGRGRAGLGVERHPRRRRSCSAVAAGSGRGSGRRRRRALPALPVRRRSARPRPRGERPSIVLGFDLGDRRRTFGSPKTYADDRPADWTVTDLVVAIDGNAAWMSAPRGAPGPRRGVDADGPKVRQMDAGRAEGRLATAERRRGRLDLQR